MSERTSDFDGQVTLTIVVPMAPPRALLPNVRRKGKGGSHWREQNDATIALRWAAKAAAIETQARIEPPVIVRYDVVWPWERYKARHPIPDPDAIPSAAKAILDGFVDAGVIPDDSGAYVAEVRARGRRGMLDEAGSTTVTLWSTRNG